jgi:DNA-binding NarL/FixJ family response regulator
MEMRPRKPTVEQPSERDRRIIEAYRAGRFQKEIAGELGLSQTGVGKILKKHGVPSNERRISAEEKDLVVSLYASGKTSREIGEELNIDYTYVCRILKDRGIERRTRRKWFFDETFFQRSDDRVAYWMGFFMADGNLGGV